MDMDGSAENMNGHGFQASDDQNSMLATSIYRVDLKRLAGILGCSDVNEVLAGFSKDVQDSVGAVVEAGQQVKFRVQQSTMLFVEKPPRIRRALVTSAHRRGELDRVDLPKELLVVGGSTGMTIIELILYNLFRAGITRVDMLIGDKGESIMDHVKHSAVNEKLDINFINLGGEYGMSHAQSIIAARKVIKEPFVMCTSDHIFEPSLIYDIANYDLGSDAGVVLVEDELEDLDMDSLPSSAVYVQRKGSRVQKIARRLRPHNAVEGGLFNLTTEIFDSLIDQATTKAYFTLAEALQEFAAQDRLACMGTDGRLWLSIETREQLTHVNTTAQMDQNLDAKSRSNTATSTNLFPWQFQILTAPEPEDLEKEGKKALLIGLPQDREEIDLDIADIRRDRTSSTRRRVSSMRSREASISFGIIPVQSNKEFEGTPTPTPLSDKQRSSTGSVLGNDVSVGEGEIIDENEEMAWMSARGSSTFKEEDLEAQDSGERVVRKETGVLIPLLEEHAMLPHMGGGSTGGAMAVSVPFEQTGEKLDKHEAFLVEVPAENENEPSEFVLAVPQEQNERGVASLGECLQAPSANLPSDIVQLSLETEMIEEVPEPQIHAKVTRKVPIIGWLILVVALCSNSATGPLEDSFPFPKLLLAFWRQTASSIMFIPFAAKALMVPEVRQNMRDWGIVKYMLAANLGSAICNTFFYLALMFTGIPQAALFSSTTPLILVFVKVVKKERIEFLEGLGALVGVFGAALVSLDSGSSSSSSDNRSMAENLLGMGLAFVAACGTAAYFYFAKHVRHKVDIFVLSFVGNIIMSIFTLLVMLLILPSNLQPSENLPYSSLPGILFGYFTKWDLLKAQFFVSFILDMLSGQGSLAALKYLDPLVVTVVMLTMPLIATSEGLLMGIGSMPGSLTILGGFVVIVGTGFIVNSSSKPKTIVIDASETIEEKVTEKVQRRLLLCDESQQDGDGNLESPLEVSTRKLQISNKKESTAIVKNQAGPARIYGSLQYRPIKE